MKLAARLSRLCTTVELDAPVLSKILWASKTCSHIPMRRLQGALFQSVVWIAVRTPIKRLDHTLFLKAWAVASSMHALTVLRDHDVRRDVLSASAFLQSLRSTVHRLTDSSSFPPYRYLTHKNATNHDNHAYASSCRRVVSRHCIHRSTSQIRLQNDSDFLSLLLALPGSSLPELVMHVRCTQWQSSVSELNSVDRRCV